MSWHDYCNVVAAGINIGAGKWTICPDDKTKVSGDDLIYYTKPDGNMVGTQASDIQIVDPVYGRIWP